MSWVDSPRELCAVVSHHPITFYIIQHGISDLKEEEGERRDDSDAYQEGTMVLGLQWNTGNLDPLERTWRQGKMGRCLSAVRELVNDAWATKAEDIYA